MTALRNADAAGDADAANRIAAMIRKQKQNVEATQTDELPADQNIANEEAMQQSIPQQSQYWPTPRELNPVTKTDRNISDVFTGADRVTPEIESISEIGSAPELNEMSWSAIKTSLGLLASGDESKAELLIKENIPTAEFSKDSKGNSIVTLPSGSYALNKPGFSGADIARGVFDLAAFTPAGRASTLGRAAAGSAATEAGLQAVSQSVGGGDISPSQIALAGGLGVGGKALENVASSLYRGSKGAIPAEEAALIERGAQEGVPVMTSDVIQPETLAGKIARSTGEKIPFVGTGQPRAMQQSAREKAVMNFTEQYQSPSYNEIISSMKERSSSVKSAAGSILNRTSEKLDNVGDIPTDNARIAINDSLESLSSPNVRVDESAVIELSELKSLMDMPQTFSSLKENRTIARDILESFGKGDRSQLPTRSKSLLNKALNGMSKDMDEFAKNNLTPKEFSSWKKANSVYAGEAQKLKKSKIKNILDKGDVTPENVNTMLFSKKPSEVKMLYNSLNTSGKNNARAALITKAFDNASKQSGGVSTSSFSSQLNKISKNTSVFFRGDDRRQLEGFNRLMESTRRAQDAAVETPTGQQLTGIATGIAALSDLAGTVGIGSSVGGLARVYESPIVRNALLRVASVPKGSDKYLRAIEEAQSAITTIAQVERRENNISELNSIQDEDN